jgi:THO complex subunit 4
LGRSDGVAYVTYTSISDANEAIRKFNGANAAGTTPRNVVMSGQPITVTLDVEVPARRSGPIDSRPRGPRGPRNGPRGGGRLEGGRGGPRGGSREGGRGKQTPRSQEDLDKELDDFMNGPPPGENGNGTFPDEEMALD